MIKPHGGDVLSRVEAGCRGLTVVAGWCEETLIMGGNVGKLELTIFLFFCQAHVELPRPVGEREDHSRSCRKQESRAVRSMELGRA
jgi:hypothetical protein